MRKPDPGKRIQYLRLLSNTSLRELSYYINMYAHRILDIENRKHIPNVSIICRFAYFFGVSPHYFLRPMENADLNRLADLINKRVREKSNGSEKESRSEKIAKNRIRKYRQKKDAFNLRGHRAYDDYIASDDRFLKKDVIED